MMDWRQMVGRRVGVASPPPPPLEVLHRCNIPVAALRIANEGWKRFVGAWRRHHRGRLEPIAIEKQ